MVWRVHWRAVASTDWSLSLRSSGRYHHGLDLFPPDQAFAALYTSLAPLVIFPQNLPEPLPIRSIRSTELPLDGLAGERPNEDQA